MRAVPDQLSRHVPAAPSARASRLAGQGSALQRMVNGSARLARQGHLSDIVNRSARVRAQSNMGQLVAQGRRMGQEEETRTESRQRADRLPQPLRGGIFQLSGIDLGNATVHHNSPAPGRVRAHAYAQGGQIHLGPGQERHLPHEAWHLVQQAQGRVRPTLQAKGMAVNDDAGLEKEADLMGARAAALGRAGAAVGPDSAPKTAPASSPVQAFWMRQDGKPEWVNNARKVDALLSAEPAADHTATAAGGTFEPSFGGSTIYRQSPLLQVPWSEVSHLISLLGAAKVQAIYVRQFPLWGTSAGLAAIDAQLAQLAKLDLTVMQALFAHSADTVSHLLTTASQADFARIFSGKREQQLTLAKNGAFRDIALPLPAAEPAAPAAAPQAADASDGGGAAMPEIGDRREAIKSAVAEKAAGRQAHGRTSPAQQLEAAAQQWASNGISQQIASASADHSRNAGTLASLAQQASGSGNIFAGVQERVRDAITKGPYQAEDAVVKTRRASALVHGDYRDADGQRHPGAVHGRFDGTVSGIDGVTAQQVSTILAKGAGTACAELQGRALGGGRVAGTMSGRLRIPNAFVSIRSDMAHFEGAGRLDSRMDGPVHTPDTGPGVTGRQIITDGAHNRAVLGSGEIVRAGAPPGESVAADLHGTTQGWGHPVRNAGRYANLTVTVNAVKQRTAGIFQPDTLNQIVHHAGAAGTSRLYRQRGEGDGPASLDGKLLADTLTVEGQLGQLVASEHLSMPMARMAQLRLAVGMPEAKPTTTAPDIDQVSSPKPGTSYSTTIERKKVEFKLDAMNLPSKWSGDRFGYRYRLEYKSDAHYVPEN